MVPAVEPNVDDPYRWAQALLASGQAPDVVRETLVGGGVDAGLAGEVVAAVLRQRPRLTFVSVLKIVFGLALIGGGGATVFFAIVPPLVALLVGTGLFMLWDGLRGR